jgi:hypothetical protein
MIGRAPALKAQMQRTGQQEMPLWLRDEAHLRLPATRRGSSSSGFRCGRTSRRYEKLLVVVIGVILAALGFFDAARLRRLQCSRLT